MRTPLPLALAALALVACSDPTAGQGKPPAGGLALERILVEDPASGFITDLLDTGPTRACSLRDPCPAGVAGLAATECRIEGDAGVGSCVDPLAARAVPVTGPLQLRLVFDRRLATDTLVSGDGGAVLRSPESVRLLDEKGREVDATKDYDNSGSASDTIDPFAVPLGPALVLSLRAPLVPEAGYVIRLDPAQIRDARGRALGADVHGPIAESYALRTQPAPPPPPPPDGGVPDGGLLDASAPVGGARLDDASVPNGPVVGGGLHLDGAAPDDGAAVDGGAP